MMFYNQGNTITGIEGK